MFSQFFSEYAVDMPSLSNFPNMCGYFSNVVVFHIWLLKGEKQKMKWVGEGTSPLGLLAVTSARGRPCSKARGTATMAAYFFVCTFVIRSSDQ